MGEGGCEYGDVSVGEHAFGDRELEVHARGVAVHDCVVEGPNLASKEGLPLAVKGKEAILEYHLTFLDLLASIASMAFPAFLVVQQI